VQAPSTSRANPSPGHTVIIVDMAVNDDGKTLFLLAQGGSPTQEIHILRNLAKPNISPWFEKDFGDRFVTTEGTFRTVELNRFIKVEPLH
jgi:hypothetical protein